jgi:hypothetical protein
MISHSKVSRKHVHDVAGIFLKVKCHKTGADVLVELSQYDFHTSSQECDTCGSHGSVTIDFTCPECGESHEYELKSW